MRHTLFSIPVIGLFFVLVGGAPAHAVTVDFGTLMGGGDPIAVTDQFAADNVLFADLVADDKCGGDYCGIISQNPLYTTAAEIAFGTDTEDGTVDSVTIVMTDGKIGSSLASYIAYDLDGNVLGSAIIETTSADPTPFVIAHAGIHRIVLDDGDGDGSVLHSISFDAVNLPETATEPVVTPEPSTALLHGLGLLGLAQLRRRSAVS